MEATGVYWMTLHYMLQEAKIEVTLVNPRDFKKIKDKKTDVCDAEQLQLYHSYNLLEGAVIPEQNMGKLRTYVRLRGQAVQDSATAIQRMQKALINMNLRLDKVVSDISGVTGMLIIGAILDGERDPEKLAKYRDPRCKKSEKEIEDSLNGFYQDDYLYALKAAMKQYTFHIGQIKSCEERIQAKLGTFSTHEAYSESENDKNEKPLRQTRKTGAAKKSYEFSFDLKDEIERIAGVDLTALPGIGSSTALTLISETGLDMSVWKSEKHFASWLGLAPNNRISGGIVLSSKSKRQKKGAAISLRMSVSGLYSEANDTAIGAFFRRKKAQIGSPKAITAAANKLAKAYYRALSTGKTFEEPGALAYMELQKKKYLSGVQRRIKRWGYDIVPRESVKANPG